MSDAAMSHEQLEELAAAYALGALDDAERKVFEDHLKGGCVTCERLVAEFRGVADALVVTVPAVEPPAALRGRILAAAGVSDAAGGAKTPAASSPAIAPGAPSPRTTPVKPHVVEMPKRETRSAGFWMPLALAAMAGLAFVSWQALQLRGRLDSANQSAIESAAQLQNVQAELDHLKVSAAEQASILDLLKQRESGVTTLIDLKPAPGATGKVLWDKKQGKGYLWVTNLPQDAPDKDYELWAIPKGGAPVPAGTFSVSNGQALVPLDRLPSEGVAAFAITIEPAGGVPAPTGDMVLLGNVGG